MSTDTQTWRDIMHVENFMTLPDVNLIESQAIQSQYDQSLKLKAFCKLFQESIDATPDIDTALQLIFDPNTSKGVFLDWWALRVGVSRLLQNDDGEEVLLTDDQLRFLIFYKAAANIGDGTLYKINSLLRQLLGVTIQVFDNLNMTITIHILGVLSLAQEFILRNYGLLTRGAGVGYRIIIQNPHTPTLGFHGSDLMPFNCGVFNPVIEISM